MIVGKEFPVDLAGKKAAVLLDELDDGIHLLFDEAAFVGDHGDADDGQPLVVERLNFGYGGVKAAFEPFNQALDDFSFVLD